MGNLKQFIADPETIEILKLGYIEEKIYFLPSLSLERFQYEKVNKVLIALGAKWNKKEKGHIFDYDISMELQKVIETGIVTDWKKSTDFFFTPNNVVNEMLGLVPKPFAEELTFLEPSAGQGHILDLIKDNFYNSQLICVEQNPLHCERLKEKGYNPIQSDFLKVSPFLVDVALMNPPFSEEMEHIQHAMQFVKDEGVLISIASAGILTKQTTKGKAFKKWFEENNGYDYKLPPNSFKEAGTNVNTIMLVFQK